MLVQRIQEMRRGALILIFRDQRLAAAGIAADGVDRQSLIIIDQARIDQRRQYRDGAAGIAAGIADISCLSDLVAQIAGQFGETEDPAIIDPMRGRGVDQPHVHSRRQRDRLFRGLIGQAEDADIRLGKGLAPGGGILAPIGVKLDQADIIAQLKTVADLKTRCACLAIDENLMCHVTQPLEKVVLCIGE